MAKSKIEAKAVYFPDRKNDRQIAISFHEGRSGTYVKWISVEESTKLFKDLEHIYSQLIK
jgi:hypothetical protein